MSLKYTRVDDPDGTPKAKVDLDNGDLAALDAAMLQWGFLNQESALKFAIAVLLRANDKEITVSQNGVKIPVEPGENLLKPKNSER